MILFGLCQSLSKPDKFDTLVENFSIPLFNLQAKSLTEREPPKPPGQYHTA